MDRFRLGEDVLAAEIDKALDGDPDSADRVFTHYAMFPPQDEALIEFWTRVAAENGSAGYMLAYADHLYKRGGYVRCRRALYWLRRARSEQPATTADAEAKMQRILDDKDCAQRESLPRME